MLIGLSGSLLSHFFAERLLTAEFGGDLGEASVASAFHHFGRARKAQASQLGPASSRRAITEHAVLPLVESLGFYGIGDHLLTYEDARVALFVGLWTESLDTMWRAAVRAGLASSSAWCLCCNGREVRLVDARRTYSRAYLQFDLGRLTEDFRAFSVFWGVLRAEAFATRGAGSPLIARIIEQSARHGEAVGRSLRSGVVDAVGTLLSGLLGPKLRRRTPPTAADLQSGLDESLTVVYRILFLMFAESRGLVPNWHPIYRDHYTIEALRVAAERPGLPKGLWAALQAIARLAHSGCRAGTLTVPAFNGRLFSSARSPAAEAVAVQDDAVQSALIALSTSPGRPGGTPRARIDFGDLGVEQLGAIYESLLDYRPVLAASTTRTSHVVLARGSHQRKASGSFYTPQTITDYLVRRTLHPLVDGATPSQILGLRIVDPSMGSAAFLVAACRYLARAYERALVREGERHEGEISEADRAGFRRAIAQRCLFGIDLNPTAVQLARLSLWLATLASDKPLTFLDHHFVCGDSLLGASPADLARQTPPGARRKSRAPKRGDTPLFPESELELSLGSAVMERLWITDEPDDTVDVVRQKERRLEQLRATRRWKTLADLWCACWMWPSDEPAPGGPVFSSLQAQLVSGRAELPSQISDPLLQRSDAMARAHRFFHWPLEFPEIYFDESGKPLDNPGFDAVLGNPPWSVIRANEVENTFLRCGGVYRLQTGGRINRYQLFVERALMLVKRGGRIGIVVPSGFATDHGSAALRRRLLDHTTLETLTGFDNRRAIFPIHRSVRFILVTATSGTGTAATKCCFGLEDPAVLESVPDLGDRMGDPIYSVLLTRTLIKRLSGDQSTLPDLRTPRDLSIVERLVRQFPRLGDADGWHAEFGRELNATDDSAHFRSDGQGIPILEGKHIEPFAARVHQSRRTIAHVVAARLIDPDRSFKRMRLAYRDVASSTNRVSLIAAILPAGVATTHSLFCLKTGLEEPEQQYLCGMMNSFVANYLVRQVMTTHLGSATIENLRVPKLAPASVEFREIVTLARNLARQFDPAGAARLQALAARAYQLTEDEFTHLLSTFPLVDASDKREALEIFKNL